MTFWPFRKRAAESVDLATLSAQERIERALARLEAARWRPEGPSTPASVAAAEEALGVIFPADYRTFLLATGRPSQGPPWFGLWRVDELVNLNRHLPVFRWYPGLVGIANCGGFLVFALDYRERSVPHVVSVGLSSSEQADVVSEGDTFVEWLERTLP